MTSIEEILNLRFQYETYVENFEIPKSKTPGLINNIKWFKDNGHVKNRFKKGYKECLIICDLILKEYYKRE